MRLWERRRGQDPAGNRPISVVMPRADRWTSPHPTPGPAVRIGFTRHPSRARMPWNEAETGRPCVGEARTGFPLIRARNRLRGRKPADSADSPELLRARRPLTGVTRPRPTQGTPGIRRHVPGAQVLPSGARQGDPPRCHPRPAAGGTARRFALPALSIDRQAARRFPARISQRRGFPSQTGCSLRTCPAGSSVYPDAALRVLVAAAAHRDGRA